MADWIGYMGRSFTRELYVKDDSGVAIDLAQYTVKFVLSKDGTIVTTKDCSIIDAAKGLAQVVFNDSETATWLGIYDYEVDVVNAILETYPVAFGNGEFQDPLNLERRVPVYCQAEDVVAQLQLVNQNNNQRIVLSDVVNLGSVNISLTEMQNKIMQIEDYVDNVCRDQWRIKSSELEYYMVDNLWPGWFPHELLQWVRNWHVQPFDASKGDQLKVRRGDRWVDLLDGNYVEGIGQDFWVDYTYGLIHFYKTRPQYGTEQVMVQYRWGSTPVPYDIRRAVILLVAADYVKSEIYAVLAGEGPGFATNRMITVARWEDQAMDILKRHQRIPLGYVGQ
jgi:hypothetical protein